VDDFGTSAIVIHTSTKVKPGQHNYVAREVRTRIGEAFDREDVEIPFTQQVLHLHPTGVQRLLTALAQQREQEGIENHNADGEEVGLKQARR